MQISFNNLLRRQAKRIRKKIMLDTIDTIMLDAIEENSENLYEEPVVVSYILSSEDRTIMKMKSPQS